MQFGRWSWHLLHGDLGISIFSDVPVMALIGQRLQPTVSLTAITIVFAVLTAVTAGVIAAWRAGGMHRPRRDGVRGAGLLGAGVRASATS